MSEHESKEPPILEAFGISKTLGGRRILESVSLSLERGALKVLIGPSGGGKSTLLQCLNYLIVPDEGHVQLEGRTVAVHHRRDLYAYRQQVGMIFQDFNLFDHLTAIENVSIALRKVKKLARVQANDRAMAELRRVGLANRARQYPAELSGGQKQRVSIARALAMDPKIMLLDEPTSALDPELIGEVLSVIQDLARGGMTMLMATHQIGFIRSLAREIFFMEKGRIIEQGSPQLLLSTPNGRRTQAFIGKLDALFAEPA